MSGASGLEILTEIKRIAPGLGIIMLTGMSSADVIIGALRGHADAVPRIFTNLTHALKEILCGNLCV